MVIGSFAYVGACGALFVGQRALLYSPTPDVVADGEARVTRIETQGASVKIWHVPRPGSDAVIYFGGSSEDVSGSIAGLSEALPNGSLYLVNYRGYGGSTGSPSEEALLEDAEAVFDHVRMRHRRVTVIGRSLGSGIAVHLAAVRDLHQVVLVTPFDSVESVAQRRLPIFPVSLLLRDKFDSLARAREVDEPTLVLSAERDLVVPADHTRRLIEAFDREQVRALTIGGTSHASIIFSPIYRAVLDACL